MIIRCSLSLVCLTMIVACSPTSGTHQGASAAEWTNSPLAQSLVGEWRNSSLEITLYTAYGHEGTEVIKHDESNWEARFGMKPARTFFQEAGTYYTEYRDLNDSIFQIADGTWLIKEDSLIMTEPDFTYRYLLKVEGETAQFTAAVDGDEDGEWDDSYVEVQRRY